MKEEIVSFIRSAIDAHGYLGAVIGVSGGIDSAFVGALAVQAIGRERVLGLLLPERDSAPDTIKDSLMVCDFLGIERLVKPITGGLRSLGIYRLQPSTFLVPRKIQEAYIRNRMRMVHLYIEAEQRNYVVAGTTNRTEAVMGFYVKWGDDSADIEPILHLYKTQVFDLALELEIPREIRNKSPSPDLLPGVTDELILGISYKDLDDILMKIESGEDLSGIQPLKTMRVRKILNAAKKRKIKDLILMKEPP